MEKTKSAQWLIPTRLVAKSGGGWRVCLDLRALNDLVKQDNYPIPNMQEIFDSCHGKKIFSGLDVNCGFFRVPLKEED